MPTSAWALGLIAGAVAGAYSAMDDFGATWLWLPMWSHRVSFFSRLLAVQAPLGALLGCVLLALDARLLALVEPRTTPLGRSRVVGLAFRLLGSAGLGTA